MCTACEKVIFLECIRRQYSENHCHIYHTIWVRVSGNGISFTVYLAQIGLIILVNIGWGSGLPPVQP